MDVSSVASLFVQCFKSLRLMRWGRKNYGSPQIVLIDTLAHLQSVGSQADLCSGKALTS